MEIAVGSRFRRSGHIRTYFDSFAASPGERMKCPLSHSIIDTWSTYFYVAPWQGRALPSHLHNLWNPVHDEFSYSKTSSSKNGNLPDIKMLSTNLIAELSPATPAIYPLCLLCGRNDPHIGSTKGTHTGSHANSDFRSRHSINPRPICFVPCKASEYT